MAREFIIHVGTPKTGTSSLHYSFLTLHDAMKQNDIHYPDLGFGGFNWVTERGASSGNADVNFPKYDWGTEDRMQRLEHMIAAALDVSSGFERVLLSSENLSPLIVEEQFWQMLLAYSTKFDVNFRTVIYLRDPFAHFIACYKQCVKSGAYAGTIDEFFPVFMTEKVPASFVAHREIANAITYAQKCGIIFNLYRYEDSLPSIEQQFFREVLGMEIQEYGYISKSFNTSLNVLETEFQRGVNLVAPRLAQLFGWERTDSLLSQQVEKIEIGDNRFVLSSETREKLLLAFDEYTKIMRQHTDFGNRIESSIDETAVALDVSDEQSTYRRQIFELGKFVGLSWRHGFVRQDINELRRLQ